MQGQIIRQISNLYTVAFEGGTLDCSVVGKFRYNKELPMVGDYVIFDVAERQIKKILPRKNELTRPVIANVDRALIVTSAKEPDFSPLLLDKMLSLITYNSIKPVICISKMDLLNKTEQKEIKELKKYYEKIGIKVYYNTDKNQIKRELKNKTVVLVGQSGAGKSSLLNRLDITLNLDTNPISLSLGRGKHTTRHTELFKINDTLFADTPGFSALTFKEMKKKDIAKTFVEFKNERCKFTDCLHHKEKDCAIKELVEKNKILQSRYNSYLKILEEAGD